MKHVVIIGAGIIGAASAYALSKAGCRVTVVEAARTGGIASSASFGWLNASFHLDQAHFHLRLAGMAAHRHWAKDLPGYHHWPGCLWFEEQGEALSAFEQGLRGLGYPLQRLSQADIQARWPAMVPPKDGVFLPDEGVIAPVRLVRGLLAAAQVEVWEGSPVLSLIDQNGRISGLRLESGTLYSDEVVIAAGNASANLIAPYAVQLPMLSRPGALVVTRPVAPLSQTLLCGPMGEVWQRPDGRVLIPSSPGHQGDASETLSDSPGQLAQRAISRLETTFPGIDFALETVLVANRPVPGDCRPVLDRVLPGLTLAVMHSGATLAALAGDAVANLITKGQMDDLWRPYGLARFQT